MEKYGYHHAWTGLCLLIAGFMLIVFKEQAWGLWIALAGLVVYCDDLFQHWRQIKEPTYRSFLNKLYGETLYKIKFIRKLNEWFDKIFGG